MPRPGRNMNMEKSKDFKGSMKRLIGNLKTWKYIMALSLLLAMISAILSLIAPDKLSSLTDTITVGISPNQEKLELIGRKIGSSFNKDKIQSKIEMLDLELELNEEEKLVVDAILARLATSTEEQSRSILLELPENVVLYFLEDFEMDGTVISKYDQLEMLKITTQFNGEVSSEQMLQMIDKLPQSIYRVIEPKIDIEKVKSIAIFMAFLY